MELSQLVQALSSRRFPIPWPGQWVANAWLPVKRGAVLKTSFNPSTGEKLIDVFGDKSSVDAAIEAASAARRDVAALPADARIDLLRRFRQTLTDFRTPAELALRIEAGKPQWEAEADFDAAVKYLDWVVQHPDEIFKSLLAPAQLGPSKGAFAMLPIGVVAAYLPFSTPLTSFVFYFAAAVVAGCPLILNSSSHAFISSLLIALLSQEAELPAGLLTIVFGNFNSFKQLIGDRRIAAIVYTGSREHCDTIRAESKAHVGRQVVLQSGGKNAVIVHSSADLELAVRCVAYGALKSAGQRCSSTSRVFVFRSLLPEFRERLVEVFRATVIGRTDVDVEPGKRPFMGPLYSSKAVEKYLRFQTMANREAEKTLLWGKALETLGNGFFVAPSVHYLTKFDNASAYQGNVLFSPNVAVYDYDVLDNAIDQINTTDAAFAVSFIGDPEVIAARRQLFLAPNLLVNTPTVETEATLPLAGRLQSGHHRFHGPGIALYLCYPQVLAENPALTAKIRAWPWPAS